MDLNRPPVPSVPVSLEVYFTCRSKTELRDIFIRERGEQQYQNFLRSSRPLVIPKVHRGNLWYYIFV